MMDGFHILVLAVVALAASTLAAISGFGGAAVLLPALTWIFGVREAIPILTVAQLIGNGSRVWFNRRELDWRVVAWFALGGVPMALLGGWWLGQVAGGIDWRAVRARGGYWLLLLVPTFLIVLKALFPIAGKRPFTEATVNDMS